MRVIDATATGFRYDATGRRLAAASSPLTTKGDLFTRSSSADARLAAGSNDGVLTPASGEATGLKWLAAPSSNKAEYVLGFDGAGALAWVVRTHGAVLALGIYDAVVYTSGYDYAGLTGSLV